MIVEYTNPQHVLLVEDDAVIGLMLRRCLSDEGIACTHLLKLKDAESFVDNFLFDRDQDGKPAATRPKAAVPDAVILDYYMDDGKTALELCATIRAHTNLPVLMLTGETSVQNTVSCLEAGADQYLIKPFNADELLARLRASLRARMTTNDRSAASIEVKIDRNGRVASFRGKHINLTEKEAILASVLAANPGIDVSRHSLMEKICGFQAAAELNSRRLDMLVGRLRRKLAGLDASLDILSARKYGYKLAVRNPDAQ